MDSLVLKYANKLFTHGLTEKDAPVIGALDTDVVWNKKSEYFEVLEDIFPRLNINSLLFSKPKEPYNTILNYLTKTEKDTIYPKDCETRTFLHDLPIARSFDAETVANILSNRKSVIIPEKGIMTFGTVSPEQAFVVYSSVCFSTFVKFFSDYLTNKRNGKTTPLEEETFKEAIKHLQPYPDKTPELKIKPIESEEDVYKAMFEAGKLTVDLGLVDSYFGNISFRQEDILYISQTGSSLDELNGCIDPCPLDNSSCCGITASSELTAHKEIVENSKTRAIVHGHPKFSVILSLYCDKEGCEREGECHIKCTEPRHVKDVPIIPGEVGTGKYGICNTLPPAIKDKRGAIVYGHGVFARSENNDFVEAFGHLLDIEKLCKEEYFKMVEEL